MEFFYQESGLFKQSVTERFPGLIQGNLISDKMLYALRLVFLCLSSLLLTVILRDQGLRCMLYLSDWGVFLVTFQFASLSLSIRSPRAQRFAELLYELTWATQWLITVLFWVAIYPVPGDSLSRSASVHGGMLALVILDYCACCHQLKASNWKFVAGPMSLYFLFIVVASLTVTPVYPVITFKDITSYILLSLCLCVVFISLYLGVKLGSLKDRHGGLAEVQMNSIL